MYGYDDRELAPLVIKAVIIRDRSFITFEFTAVGRLNRATQVNSEQSLSLTKISKPTNPN